MFQRLQPQTVLTQILPLENANGRKLVELGQLCERKNGRGVDPNRNWDAHWGFKESDYDPAEEYPGAAPFRLVICFRVLLNMSVCLSVYLPVCLPVCLSVCTSLCLSVHMSVCLGVWGHYHSGLLSAHEDSECWQALTRCSEHRTAVQQQRTQCTLPWQAAASSPQSRNV